MLGVAEARGGQGWTGCPQLCQRGCAGGTRAGRSGGPQQGCKSRHRHSSHQRWRGLWGLGTDQLHVRGPALQATGSEVSGETSWQG